MTNSTNELSMTEYERRQQQLMISNLENNQPVQSNRQRIARMRTRANAHEQLINTLESIKVLPIPAQRHQLSRDLILNTLKGESDIDEFCFQVTSDVFIAATLYDEESLNEFMKFAPKAVAFIESYNRTPGTEHIAVDSFDARNPSHIEAFNETLGDEYFSLELVDEQRLPFIHFPRHCWYDHNQLLTPTEMAYHGALGK